MRMATMGTCCARVSNGFRHCAAAVGDDELLDVIRRMRALWEWATPEERAELLALSEDVLGPAPDVN